MSGRNTRSGKLQIQEKEKDGKSKKKEKKPVEEVKKKGKKPVEEVKKKGKDGKDGKSKKKAQKVEEVQKENTFAYLDTKMHLPPKRTKILPWLSHVQTKIAKSINQKVKSKFF